MKKKNLKDREDLGEMRVKCNQTRGWEWSMRAGGSFLQWFLLLIWLVQEVSYSVTLSFLLCVYVRVCALASLSLNECKLCFQRVRNLFSLSLRSLFFRVLLFIFLSVLRTFRFCLWPTGFFLKDHYCTDFKLLQYRSENRLALSKETRNSRFIIIIIIVCFPHHLHNFNIIIWDHLIQQKQNSYPNRKQNLIFIILNKHKVSNGYHHNHDRLQQSSLLGVRKWHKFLRLSSPPKEKKSSSLCFVCEICLASL